MRMNEIIRKRRAELGLTMAQLASAVGVSEATVSRWESGHIENMRRDKIAALAATLLMKPSALMGMEDTPANTALVLSPEEQYLIRLYRSCSPAIQRAGIAIYEEQSTDAILKHPDAIREMIDKQIADRVPFVEKGNRA